MQKWGAIESLGISTISVSGSLANTYNIRKTLLDRHTEIDFSSKTDFRQSGRLSKMKKTVFLRVEEEGRWSAWKPFVTGELELAVGCDQGGFKKLSSQDKTFIHSTAFSAAKNST